MALFSDIAIKCELPNCRIHSYLPFKCVHCNLNFCELHCAAEEHFCKKAENKNPRKKACEYCGSIIIDKREEIEKHLTHECRKKKHSLYICQKNDCKTVLNGVNFFRCKFCKMMFCLPHRYPEIHNCYKKEKKKKKSFVEKYFYFF